MVKFQQDDGLATVHASASTFFATAAIEHAVSVHTSCSDGDLWPTCWADDGALYTANGDGRGFSDEAFQDIVVNRVFGEPESGITGERLAAADEVGKVWGDPAVYNRKPTGMVCTGGRLYLAYQDLHLGPGDSAFNDAPNASVSWSDDHGLTWQQTTEPMFTGHVFTTIFFADFGRDSSEAAAALGPEGARYVYAYGLDGNWRGSFSGTVPDPEDLYLARVPGDAVHIRQQWEFYAGTEAGEPLWSSDINAKTPVLHDDRRHYRELRNAAEYPHNLSVLSQGGVVYIKPLKRYIYTSWTEYTFEFYEAPAPWGPWKLFLNKDFGGYPWHGVGAEQPKHGGYATIIPSKFVSADGLSMWVQSNSWVGNAAGEKTYSFDFRKLTLSLFDAAAHPDNEPDSTQNLATLGHSVVPIERSVHLGHRTYFSDGSAAKSEDSFDQGAKDFDYWGFTWDQPYTMNEVVYTVGEMFSDGGWFSAGLRVEVRQNFTWVMVQNMRTEPQYPYGAAAGPFKTYSFFFEPIWGDGVRIAGQPGGTAHFTSIAELEIYYRDRQ